MRDDNDDLANAAFESAAGIAAITVTGFAAAILFPLTEPGGRVLLVVAAVGVLSAVFSDWRACLAVAIIAALVYVGFLGHRDGVLTGDATPWSFTPLIGCAALLGRGYRWMQLWRSSGLRASNETPPLVRLRGVKLQPSLRPKARNWHLPGGFGRQPSGWWRES